MPEPFDMSVVSWCACYGITKSELLLSTPPCKEGRHGNHPGGNACTADGSCTARTFTTLETGKQKSAAMVDNTEATELLLKIILKKDDVQVISVVGQRELQSPVVGGRDIRLDILAKDSIGKHYNVEV